MTAPTAGASALLLVGAAAACAQSAALPAGAELAPRLSPVLGQVLDRVLETSGNDTAPGLFRRLARGLGADVASTTEGQAAVEATATVSPRGGTRTGATRAMAKTRPMPTLAYAMELLDPATFAVLRPVPVAGSGALLRTGEVFVLQFSTNLPGRVRLENIDPKGQVSDLGTYTVLVDQLNRLPRDRGIQLQGQPGVEKLRFYFYPCLPAQAAGKPWVDDFQGQLPPCDRDTAALAANASSYGAVTPRALVNLAQPDATMVFATSNDYKSGDTTLMEATLRHERPAPARGH